MSTFWKMELKVIPSLLLLTLASTQATALLFGLAKDLPRTKCSPLELSTCSQLGYNRTRYTPSIYLTSRRSEVFEYFGLLRMTKCSKDLLFFICMMYQPICFEDYDKVIPPCRSVCENVRDGCIGIVTRYGFHWPEELDCQKLPDHHNGVCIKPSAIIKNQIYEHESKQSENSVSSEKKATATTCPLCPQPRSLKKFRYFKRADFALQGQFIKRSTGANGETSLSVKVLKTYKIGEVGLPTSGIVELKSENACFCPNMKLDKTYIILGYQNAKRKQLLFDDRVIAEVSTPFFERRMMKYALRYQERLQKRRQKKLRLLRKKKTR